MVTNMQERTWKVEWNITSKHVVTPIVKAIKSKSFHDSFYKEKIWKIGVKGVGIVFVVKKNENNSEAKNQPA